MGVTPSWGDFILGLVAFIVSFTLACFEKEIDMPAPMIATICVVAAIGLVAIIIAVKHSVK